MQILSTKYNSEGDKQTLTAEAKNIEQVYNAINYFLQSACDKVASNKINSPGKEEIDGYHNKICFTIGVKNTGFGYMTEEKYLFGTDEAAPEDDYKFSDSIYNFGDFWYYNCITKRPNSIPFDKDVSEFYPDDICTLPEDKYILAFYNTGEPCIGLVIDIEKITKIEKWDNELNIYTSDGFLFTVSVCSTNR